MRQVQRLVVLLLGFPLSSILTDAEWPAQKSEAKINQGLAVGACVWEGDGAESAARDKVPPPSLAGTQEHTS